MSTDEQSRPQRMWTEQERLALAAAIVGRGLAVACPVCNQRVEVREENRATAGPRPFLYCQGCGNRYYLKE